MLVIACGFVPALALACELAARPALAGRPVAVLDEADRVLDASGEAIAYGVQPGMTARAAAASCPTLEVIALRPALVARAADALIDALAVVTPLVEDAASGLVYGDLRGLDGLYPSGEAMAHAILDAAPRSLPFRVGVAAHRFTALVAAQSAGAGEVCCIDPTDERAFLASAQGGT